MIQHIKKRYSKFLDNILNEYLFIMHIVPMFLIFYFGIFISLEVLLNEDLISSAILLFASTMLTSISIILMSSTNRFNKEIFFIKEYIRMNPPFFYHEWYSRQNELFNTLYSYKSRWEKFKFNYITKQFYPSYRIGTYAFIGYFFIGMNLFNQGGYFKYVVIIHTVLLMTMSYYILLDNKKASNYMYRTSVDLVEFLKTRT